MAVCSVTSILSSSKSLLLQRWFKVFPGSRHVLDALSQTILNLSIICVFNIPSPHMRSYLCMIVEDLI